MSIANQKSVRYSFSKSYFTNLEFQNVNKAFVYITDCNPSLSSISFFVVFGPALLDHCLKQVGFDFNAKIGKDINIDQGLLQK